MNTNNSDDDLRSLRDAYRGVGYRGRLADDVLERLSVRDDEYKVLAGDRQSWNRRQWTALGTVAIVASAALFALCILQVPRPNVESNRAVADSESAEGKTEIADASRDQVTTTISGDVAVDPGNTATAFTEPSDRQGGDANSFYVFVPRRDRVRTRRSAHLASPFRTKHRRTKTDSAGHPFSIFPASSMGYDLERKPQSELGTVHQPTFDLFPAQLRHSKST